MKKLFPLVIFCVTVTFLSSAQLHEARVLGTTGVGTKEIAGIIDLVTECKYKTDLFEPGLLKANEVVQLNIKGGLERVRIEKPNLPVEIYAKRYLCRYTSLSPNLNGCILPHLTYRQIRTYNDMLHFSNFSVYEEFIQFLVCALENGGNEISVFSELNIHFNSLLNVIESSPDKTNSNGFTLEELGIDDEILALLLNEDMKVRIDNYVFTVDIINGTVLRTSLGQSRSGTSFTSTKTYSIDDDIVADIEGLPVSNSTSRGGGCPSAKNIFAECGPRAKFKVKYQKAGIYFSTISKLSSTVPSFMHIQWNSFDNWYQKKRSDDIISVESQPNNDYQRSNEKKLIKRFYAGVTGLKAYNIDVGNTINNPECGDTSLGMFLHCE